MFLSMLALFGGPFNKLIGWIAVITIVFGMGFGYLKYKEHEAAAAALIQFNAQQLAITTAQNEKYKADLDALKTHENELTAQLSDLDKQNEDREKFIDNYISTHKSKVLDPLFNEVLKQMRGK